MTIRFLQILFQKLVKEEFTFDMLGRHLRVLYISYKKKYAHEIHFISLLLRNITIRKLYSIYLITKYYIYVYF